jgi:uncharacterized RDD family membrane protein YckC
MEEYLPKRLRLLNWFIDTVLSLFLYIVIIRLVISNQTITPEQGRLLKYVFIIFNFAYYLLFEAYLNKTPAKYLTRTAVNSQNNQHTSFYQIFIRSIARYIPFEPLFIFFREDNKSLHDVLSKTQTVKSI